MTPKQRRTRKKSEQPVAELEQMQFSNPVLDKGFDEQDGDIEFTNWRWPARDAEAF